VPNLVGFTMQKGQLTGELAILTPVSWSQTTNLEVFVPSGPNLERFAFTADSDFYRRVIAARPATTAKRTGGSVAD
jgi:hypothetical protein